MKYTLSHDDALQTPADCLIVAVPPSGDSPLTAALHAAAPGWLEALRAGGSLDLRCGRDNLLPAPEGIAARQVLLIGVGSKPLDAARFRKVAEAPGAVLRQRSLERAITLLPLLDVEQRDAEWIFEQTLLGFDAGHYRYEATRTVPEDAPSGASELVLAAPAAHAGALARAEGIRAGVELARELGNLPPNICNPAYLADRARQIAAADRVSIDVLDRTRMEDLGMGALLAVAAGSRNDPQLIILHYHGAADADARPYALVGKGITFDTGGISLKPGKAMDEMKYDMCGAAGVLGAFLSVVELGLPINVVAAVPAVENMPDGQAYRPGDVVQTMSGQQVEVLNTDAEGRLILCDALTYVQRFDPVAIIDAATLTGACVVALGHHASGLMTPHDDLAEEILAAGEAVHDRAWRLPVWDDYQEQLDTRYADMANIGGPTAGAITAGCFLARFTTDQRWAHLDVAGAAWVSGPQKGATGRPAGILTRYLIDRSLQG